MNNSNCYNVQILNKLYKPIALIFHHYPTENIIEKVKGKQASIFEYSKNIGKIKKKNSITSGKKRKGARYNKYR